MVAGDNYIGDITKLGLDAWAGYDTYKNVRGYFESWSTIRTAFSGLRNSGFGSYSNWGNTWSAISKVNPPGSVSTMFGKLAPPLAAIDIGISSFEMGANIGHGDYAGAVGNLGSVLMSSAVIASVSGVGAPVAAGLALAGGALWLGSTIYKNWDKVVDVGKKTVEYGKKAVKGVKKAVGGAINKVKGWFS
ncbi:hypothetical protein ACFQ49_00160 [Kroppenstedtia eburnea]|uniref:hypothetical protein n=1 Tax=Kroppenstedtia eburnea TaxID=714067 RepID=UPI00362FE69E